MAMHTTEIDVIRKIFDFHDAGLKRVLMMKLMLLLLRDGQWLTKMAICITRSNPSTEDQAILEPSQIQDGSTYKKVLLFLSLSGD